MFEASEYARERYHEMVERGVRLAHLSRVRAGDDDAVRAPRLGWLRGLLARRVDGQETPLVSRPASPSASGR
jgi:hypothetical protein